MLIDLIKKGLFLSICFGLVACSDSDDDDDGNGINAIITVTAPGSGGGTNVKASMLTGSSASASTQVVDIASGDLNAFANTSGEPPEIMAREDNGPNKRDTYEANFLGDALSTQFEVQYTTAPSSTVYLPVGLEFTGPIAFTWVYGSLDVSWINDDLAYAGGATITIYYEVISCTTTSGFLPRLSLSSAAFDSGTIAAVPIALIEASVLGGDPTSGTCDVEIVLERSQPGSLDPNYSAGSITGIQTRTQTYTVTP